MNDMKNEVSSSSVTAWRRPLTYPSLPAVHRTIPVKHTASWLRKIFVFAGPGYLIAVGYMDPGNWATDIAAGSQFGYTLLSIILISNIFAIFLQTLALKLGIATGRDLAQACRDHYKPYISFILWIFCEIAIIACDLAEVLGSAIALKLLFGLPLLVGVILTTLDIFLLLFILRYGFRLLEACVIVLTLTVSLCFAYEIFVSNVNWSAVGHGFIPTAEIIKNSNMLYCAIGILGATVMPHNLYLHSSIVQTRAFHDSEDGRFDAICFSVMDSILALMLAFFINAAILILGSAVFHHHGFTHVVDLSQAYKLLSPVLGVSLASTFFACALLAAGQNSALSCTLAGQIVMEGFLNIRLKPQLIRFITRCIALVPAVIVIGIAGENKVTSLLIFSQVILSFQLPFALIPLIMFTSEKIKMGVLVNSKITTFFAWGITISIIVLNLKLISLIIF